MKRILITGENSYVGTSFTNYLNKHYPNDYQIDEISVRDDSWVDKDFSSYDVVFHVAGIVHIKETKENEHLYYKVNRDLTINVASKAKREKVKQFIFLSTMSVYGIDQGAIDRDTPTNPKSAYGKSKLQAEIEINKMNSNNFHVVILRPPMVYGPNSKGNYPRLSKLSKITPIFPNYNNKRSMVFIDNLIIFIKELIDNNKSGLYLPQNKECINTTQMVKEIAISNNHRILTTKVFNPLIKALMKISTVNKVFGDLYYEYSDQDVATNVISFKESIKNSEECIGEDLWYFHHYATPPSLNGFTRPYYFSKELMEKGKTVRTFTSSYLHFANKQLIEDNSLYKEVVEDDVNFVFVKTKSGNGGINRVFNMISYYFNVKKTAKKYIKKHSKPKNIIASSPHPLALLAGIKISKKYKINYITEVRDFWPEVFFVNQVIKKESLLGKILLKGEKWIYRNSKSLIFLKEGDFNYLIENSWDIANGGPIDLQNVNYINNGVNLKEFEENIKKYQVNDSNLNNDKFKVIYAGTIRPVNDVGILVKTAALLKDKTDIEFLIFGEGNQLDDLVKMKNELELENIHFKGYLDRKYMPYVLSKSSVNILNYSQSKYNWSRGNSSNKLFEYLASGKPIISTVKMGYSPIEKYECGLSIDPYSEKSLADTISKIYELDEKSYIKMSENATKAANEFDYKKLTEKLLNLLEINNV